MKKIGIHMINVLINAYAVSPNWGSEPGMGWNWIINIAKYCNVHVITESEWQDDIIEAIKHLPQKNNIHFYFNPVSPDVRKMCWNQGDWRFYWHYRKWQKQTLKIAQEIIANNQIDILHQLNMIGFREPGYLWKIKDIPLVWGPIGGMVSVPKSYRFSTDFKTKLLSNLKDIISNFQIKFSPRIKNMVKRSFMIAAIKEIKDAMCSIYGKSIPIINETGTYLLDDIQEKTSSSKEFNILWVGRLIPTKRLDIALKAIKLCNNPNITLTICGVGSKDEESFYQQMIKELGIEHQINWLGKVDHSEINNLMTMADLFLFTSVMEATSTVIVEAISASLPILSFNLCGFGPLVKNFAGETIEISNPEQSAMEFAEKINFLSAHPELLQNIAQKQRENRHILSWEYKGAKMFEIYSKLIKNKT